MAGTGAAPRTVGGRRGRALARSAAMVLLVGVAVGLDVSPGNDAARLWTGERLPFVGVLLVVAAVYAPLLLRWRYPRAVFLLLLTFAFVSILMPGLIPLAGLLLALHALATKTSARSARLGMLAAVFPLALDAHHGAVARTHRDVSLLLSWMGQLAVYVVLVALAWGVGRLTAQAAARAEREKHEAAAGALREERLRLARELHDAVASSVTVMLLQAAAVQHLVSDEPVRRALTTIERSGGQAMDELHRLLGLLRAVEDPAPRGAAADGAVTWAPSVTDLPDLVEAAVASGLDVSLTTTGQPERVDREVGLIAYRVVQESVHNARKHAGPGATISVSVSWSPTSLRLQVRSGGGGTPAAAEVWRSTGRGLEGLAERAELVGGTFSAWREGDEFIVAAGLPVGSGSDSPRAPVLTAS